jgi:hypothetical protein
MVDPLAAITFNDVLSQQADRFVGHLTFPSTLFGRQVILDGVLGTAGLK